MVEPFLPQYRGLATYQVPKADVQLSMSFRNVPGTFSSLINDGTTASNGFSQRAQYNLFYKEDLAVLGRSQANPQLQYDLLLPGQRYSPRLTYIDFRAGKLLKFGRTRTLVAMDLYNVFNSNTPTLLQQGFGNGSAYNNPMAIQSPRVARFNVTFDF